MIRILSLSACVVVIAGLLFVWSGIYPMGADVPHFRITHLLLETLRERSVARAASDIKVPLLGDAEMLLVGAGDYADMCASCHLQPGKTESDMSIGLYPNPPSLVSSSRINNGINSDSESRRRFWIIKHGIKASGMPAWGFTHTDQRIWAMVAFLKRLPELTPEQYQVLTSRSGGSFGHH